MPDAHRILVPFELPDHEPVPAALVEEITAMEVVVLGHFGLPEQTPPAAGREQFEDDARAELAAIADAFADGASVRTRLVFGRDRAKTIDRVALEEDCDVVLTGGETGGAVERVLVPVRGEDNLAGVLAFAAELQAACDATLTLLHVVSEDDRRPSEELFADARAELERDGVAGGRVETTAVEGDPTEEIVAAAREHDVVVLGETEPTLRERLFDEAPARVTAATDRPVFVVRSVED